MATGTVELPTDEQVMAEASPEGLLGKLLREGDWWQRLEWARVMARNVRDLLKTSSRDADLILEALTNHQLTATLQDREELRVFVRMFERCKRDHATLMQQLPVAVRYVLSQEKK